METIKIILADDHPLIREGFKSLLGRNERFEVVGEVENGYLLIAMARELQPDVVLLDISMPGTNGIDAITEICKHTDHIKFLVLSMHEEYQYITNAIKAGAHGYLLKNVDGQELERAIVTVHNGGKYFSASVAAVLAETVIRPVRDMVELTPRELEVLKLVAQGLSTKQIADVLRISIRTVESHRVNMLKKMEVNNSAELITKSIQNGWIS